MLTVKTNAVRPEWPSASATSLIEMAGLALGRQRPSSDSTCGRNEKRSKVVSFAVCAGKRRPSRRADRAPGGAGPAGGLRGGKDPTGRLLRGSVISGGNDLAAGAGDQLGED